MRGKLGLAAALTFAVLSSPAAANVLINGGFESGVFNPWTTGSTPSITSAQAHTGTYSVASFSSDLISQSFASIATSDISEVSFWAKRSGGVFDLVQFLYSDSSSDNVVVNSLGKGDDWTQFDVTSSLAAGKNLVGFQIYGTSPGPAYLDDFVINASTGGAPEPSVWAMLLAGFGAVGVGLRRRRHATAMQVA